MKTACIYHSIDLDGWVSAAIVRLWFEEKHKNDAIIIQAPSGDDKVGYRVSPIITFGNNNSLTMFGYNYGQPIPNLMNFDQVIMCDISFPLASMDLIASGVSIIQRDFIWCDHHISAIKECSIYSDGEYLAGYGGLRDVNFAACELTWKYFFPDETMPEIVRLLGRYDCFGHKQVWMPVEGYEGLYEVSNHGNVRSLDRIITENNTGIKRPVKGINLSIANSNRGYRVVVLCKDGIEKMRNVHQLVAKAFIPNPENKPCINHKDFNRLNNYPHNLEWCTYAENNLYSIEEGKKGRVVVQLAKDGKFIQQFDSIVRAESYTGIASQNIGKVCKGEREFAGGYRWEYGVDKDVFPQFVPEDEETKVLEFQYGARQIISNHEQAYEWLQNCMIEQKNKPKEFAPCEYRIWESGKSIYAYLCTEAKQSYKNGFALWLSYVYPGENMTAYTPFKFVCINKERFNPINFGIDYHSEGYDGCACFHRRSDGKWSFSLYNDNGKVDCSIIAKSFGGGGHFSASGFVCDDKVFLKIINNE